MTKAKNDTWQMFLEIAEGTEAWQAEKLVTQPYGDGGRSQIPDLVMKNPDGTETICSSNEEKAQCLTEAFFPPAPESQSYKDYEYPTPIQGFKTINRLQIRRAIEHLQPFKAPGPDGIPNVVLKKTIEIIIEHLYRIFNAVITHKYYYQVWRDLSTIVYRKPGKPSYTSPNTHRPIALYATISKILTGIVAEATAYVTEQFHLLPSTHFGGRPCRSTSEALHYLVNKITDAWRAQ